MGAVHLRVRFSAGGICIAANLLRAQRRYSNCGSYTATRWHCFQLSCAVAPLYTCRSLVAVDRRSHASYSCSPTGQRHPSISARCCIAAADERATLGASLPAALESGLVAPPCIFFTRQYNYRCSALPPILCRKGSKASIRRCALDSSA